MSEQQQQKKERIVYGSLESVLGKRRTNNIDANANDNNNKTQKLSNILQDGISKAKASGHVNIGQRVERETLELDDKTIQQQLDHANALRKIELKNVANNIAVPTDDLAVKEKLKEFGEPICYYGEDKGDRRDRLKNLMAAQIMENGSNAREIRNRLADVSAGNVKHLTSSQQQRKKDERKVDKTFYYPASKELQSARIDIGIYSFQRADKRLLEYKSKMANVEQVEKYAEETYDSIKRLHPAASQIGGTRPVSSCSLTSDNLSMVTGSWDGLCKIWNLETLELECTMRGHKERVIDVASYPTGTSSLKNNGSKISFASSSVDGTAILWPKYDNTIENIKADGNDTGMDIDTTDNTLPALTFVKPLAVLKGHADRLGRIAFHPSGKYLGTTSFDRTWRLWDVETCKELLLQEGHARETYGIAFHPDGSLVCTTSLASHGRLWDIRSGKCIMPLHGHAKPVLSVDFSPNGFYVATGSMDNTIRMWDLRKMRSIYMIPAHNHLISSVRFSPVCGEFLVSSGYDNLIKVWSTRNFQLIKSLIGHEKHVMKIDISNDEKSIYSAGFDRTWKKWVPEEVF